MGTASDHSLQAVLQSGRFVEYFPQHSNGVLWIVALTSVNALAYNLVHSAMIKRTSAVTTTVLGEVKIVGLLVLRCALHAALHSTVLHARTT